MSRVADAMQRAGQVADVHAERPSPISSLLAAEPDFAAPWDVTPRVEEPSRRASPLAAVASARAAEPAAPEFVELVQRVFRPATGEPTARSVTFVRVGAPGQRAIVLDVAQTLAGHGVGSVCVVDASFGDAALHGTAGQPAGPGLCDALLASWSAAAIAMPLDRELWLIPAGEEMCIGQGWLPEALARAMRQIAARFDFVIVEAPPVPDPSAVAALLTVASLTDGVVLILESECTRRDLAQDVAMRLRASGVTVLGAVLTMPSPAGRREPARGVR